MKTVGGGRYRLGELLGEGGMGTVYVGERADDGARVAVKLLRADLSLSEDLVRQFEREAEAASRLGHPACVRVLEVGADEGTHFLVMEQAAGEPLSQVLARTPKLPAARAVAIAAQLLDGIGAAHREGIVHRDLKPENVIVDGEAVKILDFGIARLMPAVVADGEHDEAFSLTGGGAVVGTPAYLSPEQALGEPADGRADLYAIGVMLYEMLAGRRPFEGKSPGELISAHLVKDAPPLTGAGEALAQVVARALAKRRDERWPDAAAFREALLVAPLPAPAPSDSSDAGASAPPEQPATRKLDLARPPPMSHPAGTNAHPSGGAGPRAGTPLSGVGMQRTAPLPTRALSEPLPPPPGRHHRRRWIAHRVIIYGTLCVAAVSTAVLLVRHGQSDRSASIRATLARGDVHGARSAAETLARAHPDDPRAFAVLGDALIADADLPRGLAAYRHAVHLDPALGADPGLLANLRASFGDAEHGEAAFRLAEDIGAPAQAILLDVRDHAADPRLRKRASNALASILIQDKVKQR